MNAERLRNYVAALIAVVALVVVAFIAVTTKDEGAKTALIALLSAASSWFFRGQVANPPEIPTRRNPPSGG